ncbi:hypothetical protein [Ruania albidiflava]|uniref:hypothetical protein n=1 Tax=Ruania albidiflava TaxID=366586 RepID=UPI0023F0A04E|nr:hypothetical protein [Ruania albidiflava]
MTSIGTSARTTVAAAAAALLLVVGCDDGADQSTPPEAPAEQETRAAQEEPAAGEEPSGSDEDAAGAEQDTGTGGEQDPEGTPDDGAAEPITDPCSDLTPEDVGAVLGNEVDGPMGTADVEAPEGVESEGVVACQFGPTDPGDSGASMHWLAPTMDYPDEMPEEVREEQEESWRTQTIGSGEEIEVEGASAARVEIADASGFTHLTVRAIVGDVVLWSAVFGPEGTLDESDIPSAAEMAELAISKA